MKIILAYIIFLISLAILVGLSILYTQRFRELTRYTNEVENTHTIIIELNKLMHYLTDAETGSRGFLLSGDSSFLSPYNVAMDSIKPTYRRITQLLPEQSALHDQLQRLNILFFERLDLMKHTMLLYSEDKDDFTSSLTREKLKMIDCRELIHEMNTSANNSLQASQRTKNFYEGVTPGFFLIIMGFVAIAFVISFYVLMREYTGRLKDQRDLEQKIVALDQSYKELEQIAHISSHDLQEPLRKISVFCDRLSMKYSNVLDDEGKQIINRIYNSSERTRELVEILSNYTSLITVSKNKSRLNIVGILHHVEEKFSTNLDSRKAVVHAVGIPAIMGYSDQVKLLFECLFENSVKYSSDHALEITISSESINKEEAEKIRAFTAHTQFIKIVYRDNGIGFDNQFAEKIFSIFQRLHKQEDIDGKGVGLAIVKRVMSNHNGFVTASGTPGQGATFSLYFPEN